METVAIIGLVVLAVAVPVWLVWRKARTRKARGRSRRGSAELPFLFFPTTGPTVKPPPAPAWLSAPGERAESGGALRPEPGIADLPPAAAGRGRKAVRETGGEDQDRNAPR
jgi:hypothetical protein